MLYQPFKKSPQRSRLQPATGLFTLLLALFTALGLAVFYVTPAHAAGITVDSTADTVASDGVCTLREALNNANADADTTGGDCAAGLGDDTITFGVSGTIALGGILTVQNNGKLIIDGGDAITVDGNRSVNGLFVVEAGADVTFAGLTLTNGRRGIVNNGGAVTVNHSTIANNAASSGDSGAGISSVNGVLIVRDSTLRNNTTYFFGGGIYVDGGSATIINSTFSGNYSDNTLGGSLALANGATVTVANSTIVGATFQEVLVNNSTLNLNNSIIVSGGTPQCQNNGGTVTARYSLIKDGSCGITNGVDGNLTGDPNLGALTGSPAYFPLGINSIAVDAGDNALAVDQSGNPLATDQPGTSRVQGGAVDMGAYETIGNPAITIVKDATPADGTDFAFATDAPGASTFSLDDAAPDDGDLVTDSRLFSDLPSGSYTFAETGAAGWTLTDLTCDSGNWSVHGNSVSITVAMGENVTCTFTNAQTIPATITIVKDATPADGADFAFTADGLPGQYLFQWGSPGSGDGQFADPYGVALDAAGNVYVVDSGNSRIQKFDSNGAYLAQWGSFGSGDGQFSRPVGVAVDAAGNVYVTDADNNRIQKFAGDGTYLAQWGSAGSGDGQFNSPYGVAVDAAGNVYVADGNNRIQKFDSNAAYLTQWGSGAGQFDLPSGLAVDADGNVYVADNNNNRIQKFDSDGTYLAQWGEYGDGDGQFYYPVFAAVDGAGNVYVTDGNNRIQKFASDGAYLTQWGGLGSGAGQLRFPQGIAINAAGTIYVADRNNQRIQVFGNTFSLDDATPDDGDLVTDTRLFSDLLPGSYTFTEMVTAGWELTDLTCDSGNWNVNGNSVTVDLVAGENVTCTFTNAQTITVPVITTQPQDTSIFPGETALLTVAAGGDNLSFQWYQGASGDTSTPISGATSASFTTPALTGDASYWVRVSNPAGSADSATATVTVGQLASIVIVIDATPADGTDFAFTADIPGGSTFTLDDEATQPNDGVAQSITFTDLMAANYTITESLAAGWQLTSASCTGGADSGSLHGATLTVALGAGEHITCTFSSRYNQPPVATPFATCGGYDVFETAPGVYAAPDFPGNLIVGTDGYDWLQGTAGPDLILGLQGGDDLWGNNGDDVICGGAGVDIILGQRGNDTLYGDDQPDWLIGGPGNDELYGGAGGDDLQGDAGNDVLYGESGADVLLGGAADDDLFGGDDPDALYGQNGTDDLDGGGADDYCKGGRGNDVITNCEGASAAEATADEAVDIDEEAARLSNDGPNGENAIEQRIQQLFLPAILNSGQ
ncbi:MAG: choice-of-anchor Q domain-containing protein [Caldilineaceae bacterium]